MKITPVLFLTLTALSVIVPLRKTLAEEKKQTVRFDRDVRPILSDNCFLCHGPDENRRKAKLRLDIQEEALKEVVIPGKPEESELYLRISSEDKLERMPPHKFSKQLTKAQIETIRQWIVEGANWTKHWAYLPPERHTLPKVNHLKWIQNPIDHFILARIESEGLTPSPPADKRTLLRRVTLDLTGLPPTPAQVEAFVNDNTPDAYEKLVDRLLSSPAYGERMAIRWLDSARYGDTSVYHADGRRDMWAWRDHVIQSYNSNQPFNQFSIEQLAGDLLPNATMEQKLASGFLRNNGTTDEGGLIEEEYRVEYAVDRVKTTSMVWLGLTMECGQCHDHKYDPISQKDYYRFFAYFNRSADRGKQSRNGNSAPMVKLPDPANLRRLPDVRMQLTDVDAELNARRKTNPPELAEWLAKMNALGTKNPPMPKDPLYDFPLNEGKGNVVADQVNGKRKGRIQGKPQWISGQQRQALNFNGSNFVNLGNLGDFERTGSFSYGGWVKTTPQTSGAVLARMDDAGGHRGYDLLIGGGGILQVHLIHQWPTNAIKVRTDKKLSPNKWYHVLVTYDGTSKANGVTIYVDGEPWKWQIEQDRLTESIRTKKSLLIGSRHPGARFRGSVGRVHAYNRALTQSEVQALANHHPLKAILAIAPEKRTDAQKRQLRNYYFDHEDKETRALLALQKKLKSEETNLLKPMTTVMVMNDMPKPRDTFVLERGAYDSPSKVKVFPGTPSILPPAPADSPRNRLGLAQWLFQDDHPLTSRVAVNRHWQMLFGTGLVKTPADFGVQGEFPSHPELLDWLAVDFRESGWDVKRLLKLMVTSATYRQSSRVTPELLKKDPENLLLARAPRFRLQSELIRDNALFVSGLMVRQMGGPGVKPYQPPGLWREVGLGGNPVFKQDHGDKLYRRSIYTYWKRSAPPPAMQIFDAPTREKCVLLRSRTNTPLQALVTLNDPQFVEAARAFAQKIMKERTTTEERIGLMYLNVVGRSPRTLETEVVSDVYQHALKRYRADPEAAKKLISIGDSPRDATLDVAEHAAWTVVANLVLNLDETLTRE